MNQRTPGRSMPNGWNWNTLLRDLVATWRLLWDPSVPGLLKFALPFLALIYWISPIDLIPLMPFDDIAVVLLAARLFVAMSPKDSVSRASGGNRNNASSGQGATRQDDGDVIDTTWRVIDE